MTLSKVTVHGKYHNIDGSPATGNVSFRLPRFITDMEDDVVIIPSIIETALGSDGTFSLDIPAVDQAGLMPQNFTYAMIENIFEGKSQVVKQRISKVQITTDMGDDIDIMDIVPVQDAGLVTQYLTAEALFFDGSAYPGTPLEGATTLGEAFAILAAFMGE